MATVSAIDPRIQLATGPAALGSARAVQVVDGSGAPDPQLVAEMKHEIRVLVEEVTQLAAEDIAPQEFYSGFLTRVVSAMAAVGGAVWTADENGQLKLEFQINFGATVDATPQSSARHAALLKSVLAGTQAMIVPPSAAAGDDRGAGNPTDSLLVLAPLVVEREGQAVVEIFQRPGGAPSTHRGYLRFLGQMCDVACDYLKTQRLRQLQENQSLWRQIEELVQTLHRSLNVRETAYAIVNEGRRTIGCDRVSVALVDGSRCRIEAVSGLDSIDRRAAEVQRLSRLASAVLKSREPLWSEGGDEELPRQIQAPLQAYIDQSHARLVGILPLTPPCRGETPERPGRRGSAAQPIGALIIEQLRDARSTQTLRTRAGVVARHSSVALSNALAHSSLFLLPLWMALGRVTWLFRGSALVKMLLFVSVLAGFGYALASVPTSFDVRARGKLQPAQRREIFAPLDGVVHRVQVEHGQMVEAGAILAELANTDLDLQLAALIGKQTTNRERLASLQRAMLDTKGGTARLSPIDDNRLAGEILELRQAAENIDRELMLLREKERQLTITAPQRGQVVTWKARDLLLQRPVNRGQGLLTLANPDGPWELELYLPERRLTHVQRAAQATNGPLNVTFVLSSHPGQTFRGQVAEIEQAAEVRGDEGNTILVRVAVEKEALPPLHDQTTVTAKLHCGRTSVGYAWFCDLIETIQTKVLFWLPT